MNKLRSQLMILEYHCENFRSIGNEVSFSMLASADESLIQNCRTDTLTGRSILRNAVIYGGNGSGKSNFIFSLNYLRGLILHSINFQPGDRLPYFPHKLLENQNSKFRIHFTKGNHRFLYYVELNAEKIEKEYLYHYPNNRVAKIFEREEEEVPFAKTFSSQLSSVRDTKLKENRLFLSCAANNSNIEEIDEAFKFFNNDIVVLTNQDDWLLYSTKSMESSPEMTDSVLDFMHRVGEKDLVGISAKVEERKMEGQAFPPIFDSRFIDLLKTKAASIPNIKLNYGLFTLDFSQSSDGIKKLFSLLPPFIDMIRNDRIFLVDEFETHLHPLLVSELLKMFSDAKESKAQMIFTTHDTNLLSLERFRRDQIWFTDICEKHMTDLFSLAEVKAVRKDENVGKNYLLGKYNGIPMIDSDKKVRLLEN